MSTTVYLELSHVKLLLPIVKDKKVLAKAFVDILHKHGMVWHFEDDVFDVIWGNKVEQPSKDCLKLMNELRNELYKYADLCGIWVDGYGGSN